MAELRKYRDEDYNAVCKFLIELNQENQQHINWNWARFEWMYEHPEFDKSSKDSIGLWWSQDKVVGAAIYDMYFGEGFCSVLPGYEDLYAAVLTYAYENLKDESGMGIAICDKNEFEMQSAMENGFIRAEQDETMMKCSLEKELVYRLPEGMHIEELDPAEEAYEFQWLLWQGFDHGTDRNEFEKEEKIVPQVRPHLKRNLSLAVVNEQGEKVAYCCLWYDEATDYAYVEPVCTVPSYRGKGLGKAVVFETLNRAKSMGAKNAYVISDQEFYEKLGFKKEMHFTFFWRV